KGRARVGFLSGTYSHRAFGPNPPLSPLGRGEAIRCSVWDVWESGRMRIFRKKLVVAVSALVAHQALWYAAPAQAQAEGAAETYEECVERVQSVKQRRRAGRSVGTRLADVECAPLRDVQVVEETGVAPVEGAPAQRTRIAPGAAYGIDRKSTRLNSSHVKISYAVFCLKKKKVCGLRVSRSVNPRAAY